MFQTKKKKIANHLERVPINQFTAFEQLLYDYIYGELNAKLEKLSIAKLKYHIDWLEDYKCIEIDGVCNQFFMNIQIEETEFSVAYDKDEPENYISYTLLGKEQFYQIVEKAVNEILE